MSTAPPITAVTVYCSSSSAIPPVYREAAAELGQAIARRGWKLVYGGNNIGSMGVVANAVRAAGGKVIGITPQLFIDKGLADNDCEELIIADSMRHRKALMEQRGDAFVTLPGGLGTFEEIFEIIVGKQLRYHSKPIVLLNISGYFQPLLQMIEHGIEEKFIKPHARRLYHVASSVADGIDHILTYEPAPPGDKWFDHAVPSGAE